MFRQNAESNFYEFFLFSMIFLFHFVHRKIRTKLKFSNTVESSAVRLLSMIYTSWIVKRVDVTLVLVEYWGGDGGGGGWVVVIGSVHLLDVNSRKSQFPFVPDAYWKCCEKCHLLLLHLRPLWRKTSFPGARVSVSADGSSDESHSYHIVGTIVWIFVECTVLSSALPAYNQVQFFTCAMLRCCRVVAMLRWYQVVAMLRLCRVVAMLRWWWWAGAMCDVTMRWNCRGRNCRVRCCDVTMRWNCRGGNCRVRCCDVTMRRNCRGRRNLFKKGSKICCL